MTDKKLTEILKAYTKKNNISASSVILEEYAEELVKQGVIVPPCKVGQTVYIIDEPDLEEPYVLDVVVTAIGYDIGGFWITMSLPLGLKMSSHIGERSFGKIVFLTREEAEEKLKEIKNNA